MVGIVTERGCECLFDREEEVGSPALNLAIPRRSMDGRWVMARYVDVLPNVNAPNYISMDARLGWRPNDRWEFSVVGQNLLDSHHVEFAPTLVQTTPTEVNRGVYAQIVWRR